LLRAPADAPWYHPRMSKNAVVTGAGSGLGRAISLELAKRGWRVVVSDLREDGVRETAALVRERGGVDVHVATCDVARYEEVEALAKLADDRLGSTDLLVNNAGVAAGGHVGDVPLEDWRWVLDVNLWGVIHGCHAFVPRMKKRKSGHVLNVASAAGFLSAKGMAPYCVTKAGVVALSETMNLELADDGVGVTVLCPTFFMTNILKASRGADDRMRALADVAMRRAKITAESVAATALDACEKKRLYALAGEDGRWLWRLKRISPEIFQRRGPAILERALEKWMGRSNGR
jgi:NAD(P)-dependent dehydrogenase (short-subunit alcohol dehydrogenase family)